LKNQVRRRLLDSMGWPRGEWSFDPSDAPAPDAAKFRCDPVALTHEGVAVHWPPAQLRAALADALPRYPARTKRFAALAGRLHRDDEVAALLDALDGSRTLADALGASPGPTALAAAWVLDALDAVAWRSEPVADGAAAEEAEPDAGPEFEIVVGGADESASSASAAAAR